uniref:Sen15 domain-containing protein n=1 Tax=Heterorhabditis bacteriophora TaxID=37862 RepID=A0A1I7WDY8_HETBA
MANKIESGVIYMAHQLNEMFTYYILTNQNPNWWGVISLCLQLSDAQVIQFEMFGIESDNIPNPLPMRC